MALEGPVTLWAAEHRRHHKYADRPATRTRPGRYGGGGLALLRGLLHAQVGWFYTARRRSSRQHWVPDLLADPDIRRLDAAYPAVAALSFALPARSGRAVVDVVGGRVDGAVLGRAGPLRGGPPRHLVGQLHRAQLRRARLPHPRTARRTSAGWRC